MSFLLPVGLNTKCQAVQDNFARSNRLYYYYDRIVRSYALKVGKTAQRSLILSLCLSDALINRGLLV